MRPITFTRPWPIVVALMAILISPIAGVMSQPDVAQAAPSADPSEEIVYIDANGWIRIIDPVFNQHEVKWSSPKGGWENADLGDVNADGDMEIVAIGTDASGSVQIAVYDPVVASGATDPNKEINGIPWDTLWEKTLPGYAEIILAGDFDHNIPGDELLYAYRDVNMTAQVVVMNADGSAADGLNPDGTPTGRAWKEHVKYTDPTAGRRWRYGDAGNVNDTGSDEAVLVDNKVDFKGDETRFDVFNVDGGFIRLDGKTSDSVNINKVAVGQIIKGGGDEIAEVRSAKAASESLHVYKWDAVDNELHRDESWAFAGPEFVFLADLSGNGDEEVLILRKHTAKDGVRMIMVDEWGDDQDSWGSNPDYPIEESLEDLPNGSIDAFRIGAGGDVDGDGKDEIILGSQTHIIFYTDPDVSLDAVSTVQYDLPYDSGNDILLAGDVDKNGFSKGPVFGVSSDKVSATVPTGVQKVVATIELTNIGTATNVNFNLSPPPSWASVSPMSGTTPATLEVTFNALNQPVGSLAGSFNIRSSNEVSNAPYPIELGMTVSPAELIVDPNNADMVYFPCTPPMTDTMTITIDIGGTV